MLSFVICSIDEGKFAAVSASIAAALGGEPFEIVGIHDARSLCEGWTRGLARSRGDPVVFCHDDIAIHADHLAGRLTRHLGRFDLVGVAGTDRCVGMDWAAAGTAHTWGAIVHGADSAAELCFFGAASGADPVAGIQAMDGVFLAARREVAEAVGFDAVTFDGWHGYDADFTFRAHLAGFRLGVMLDCPLVHRSRGRVDSGLSTSFHRFEAKHAGRLARGRGAWADLRTPIALPGGIAAAFDGANLDRLHERSRREARTLDELASRPYAVGRNDSCPCRSGLRYRDCHGATRR